MKDDKVVMELDVPKVRKWVSIVSPYFPAIRPPEVFEELGFPSVIVRKCVKLYRHIRLNNGDFGDARGVSDLVILSILAEAIEADCSQGNSKLCMSNRIEAWRDACIARLDEIEREETEELTEDVKSK